MADAGNDANGKIKMLLLLIKRGARLDFIFAHKDVTFLVDSRVLTVLHRGLAVYKQDKLAPTNIRKKIRFMNSP